VIAARSAMLAVSMLIVLAAFGAGSEQWQPSALRLLVTAVVGLLAPLFWPGCAATVGRTAARIVGWSAVAAALAAAALQIVGGPVQSFRSVITACALLMLILVLVHSLVAALELHWRRRSADAHDAREQAGRVTATALALLGSVPLWCGPAAELLAARHAWIVDAIVGISPLTHLAVASSNDLLRNQWFYQHSNLAGLRVSYPGFDAVAWSYATACLALAFIALASRRWRRPVTELGRT
jgi:hypothetical protein